MERYVLLLLRVALFSGAVTAARTTSENMRPLNGAHLRQAFFVGSSFQAGTTKCHVPTKCRRRRRRRRLQGTNVENCGDERWEQKGRKTGAKAEWNMNLTLFSPTKDTSRRALLERVSPLVMAGCVAQGGVLSTAQAAPPMAVLAEELGYFPVNDGKGDTRYVPAPIQRSSTDQAVTLARHLLQNRQALMYGAYWCPHCRHQRELWGREAFAMIPYVECSPQGFAFRKACPSVVDGFPTWALFPSKQSSPIVRGGEVSLTTIVQLTGYDGPWDEELERETAPPPLGGAACR